MEIRREVRDFEKLGARGVHAPGYFFYYFLLIKIDKNFKIVKIRQIGYFCDVDEKNSMSTPFRMLDRCFIDIE